MLLELINLRYKLMKHSLIKRNTNVIMTSCIVVLLLHCS